MNEPNPSEANPIEFQNSREGGPSGLSPKAKKEIREWVVSLAVALVVFFFVRTFLFTVIRVDGSSMRETLQNGDRMIVTIIDRKLYGIGHGDVVICHYPNREQNFVKRVVGLGGDVIEIKDGVVFRNGDALSEPYIVHKPDYDFAPYEVPEGKVFVLGDNRSDSNDSHRPTVGAIDESEVIGIARLIIWPFSRMGSIGGT